MTRLRSIIFAAALALASCTAPAFAGTITAAQWSAMTKAAKPGSVIDLGDNDVEFARGTLSDVTIKGGRFGAITIDAWKNVTFDGSKFEIATSKGDYQIMVLAYDPEGLTFRNCDFRGAEFEGVLQIVSMSIRGGKNVTVERSRFTHMANNITFHRTDGVRFVDNDLSDIREGVQLAGASNVVISRNRIGPFKPTATDHADGVQLFTAGLAQASTDVLIEGNLITSTDGARAQCIFMRDEAGLHAQGKGYARVTVRGNRCVGTGWHGITAQDPIADLIVDGNEMIRVDGSDVVKNNWIMSNSGKVTNNRASLIQLGAGVEQGGNVTTGPSTEAEAEAAIAVWMKANRAAAPTVPAPVPPKPVPATQPNTELLDRAVKARKEANDLKNGAARAVYALDQLIIALTPKP